MVGGHVFTCENKIVDTGGMTHVRNREKKNNYLVTQKTFKNQMFTLYNCLYNSENEIIAFEMINNELCFKNKLLYWVAF